MKTAEAGDEEYEAAKQVSIVDVYEITDELLREAKQEDRAFVEELNKIIL